MSAGLRGAGRVTRTILLVGVAVALLALVSAARANAEGEACSRGFTNGLTEPSVIEGFVGGVHSWSVGGGHSVLEGEGFEFASAVTVGDQPAGSFAVLSDTELELVAPPEDEYAVEHGHAVEVAVITPGGTSYSCPLGRNELTYVAAPQPTVSFLSPAQGPEAGGTAVTIFGSGYTQNEVSPSAVTAVDFGSTPATSFELLPGHELRAVAPAGVGSQFVTVITAGGTSATGSASEYKYKSSALPPEVAVVTPKEGSTAGGNTVTIKANHSAGVTAVSFGATPASSFVETVAGTFEAVAPAGTGSVDIRLTGPGGTSPVEAQDRYTYRSTPVITSLEPTSGVPAGHTQVRIHGSGLKGPSTVDFGSVQAEVIERSETEAVVNSPAHAAGTVDVTVTSAGGTSATSGADQFTYAEPPPTVTAISPSKAIAELARTVTITGTGFKGVKAVRFGGTESSHIEVDSATKIEALAPALPVGSVHVTVEATSGTSSTGAGDEYTTVPRPAVSNVSPAAGADGGGNEVTITGGGLGSAERVFFGGRQAQSFKVESEGQIVAVAPASADETVDITVQSLGAQSTHSAADHYTFYAVPSIQSLSPGSGPAAGGTAVTLHGESLAGVTGVSFGGVPATSFETQGSTRITAIAPAGAGTVDVTVSTPFTSSATGAGDRFTYVQPPVITGISPDHAVHGSGTQEVTISGHNLDHVTSITDNETGRAPIKFKEDTATSVVVTLEARDRPGIVEITVHTEYGGASAPTPADVFNRVREERTFPELGRCTKLSSATGGYSEPKCSKVAAGHAGKYEWSVGLTLKHVTFSGAITFEAPSGSIACSSVSGSGQEDGASELDEVSLVFHGCKRLGSETCSSGATAGDIETPSLIGVLGWAQNSNGGPLGRLTGALALMPRLIDAPFAQFSCGAHAVRLGNGVTTTLKDGKTTASSTIKYAGKKGVQSTAGLTDAAFTRLSEAVDGTNFQDAVASGTLTLTGEEPFAINTVL